MVLLFEFYSSALFLFGWEFFDLQIIITLKFFHMVIYKIVNLKMWDFALVYSLQMMLFYYHIRLSTNSYNFQYLDITLFNVNINYQRRNMWIHFKIILNAEKN